MADNAKHKDTQDKKGFSKGKTEAPRKKTPTAKDTAKTREAKRSKGGQREGAR
jgi:hypothetical protein